MKSILLAVLLTTTLTASADEQRSLGELARRNRQSVPCPPPAISLLNKQAPPLRFQRVYKDRNTTFSAGRNPQLIDFWHVGCGPCIKALPRMRQISRDFSSRLEIVMVHPVDAVKFVTGPAGHRVRQDSKAEDVLPQFIQKFGITVPVAIAEQKYLDAYGVPAFPLYVLIDSKGIVRYQSCSLPEYTAIEAMK